MSENEGNCEHVWAPFRMERVARDASSYDINGECLYSASVVGQEVVKVFCQRCKTVEEIRE